MRLKRIAVLVSGGGSNLQTLIDGTKDGSIPGEIVLVLSSASKAYALERAHQAGIPAVAIPKGRYPDMEQCNAARHRAILQAEPDLIVLAGFLGILPAETVRAYPNRIINVHPALIPSFCGKGMYGERVHQAVLDYGAKVSGVTVHFVDEGTDTGPIIFQHAVPVNDGDDAHSLAERVLEQEHIYLPRAVSLFLQNRIKVDGRKVTVEN